MIHRMKLVDFAFKKMKSKEKTIEIRLNDEKRQLIKVGDIIEFKHVDTGDILKTQVIKLHKFNTFQELFDKFEHSKLGIKEDDDASIMNNFYTENDQKKYKALGIEIKVI